MAVVKIREEITGDEPLSLAEAKLIARAAPGTAENDFIEMLISAARIYCENFTGRSMIERRIAVRFDSFSERILLPKPSVDEIISVTLYENNGTAHDVQDGYYEIIDGEWGEIAIYERPDYEVAGVEIVYRTCTGELPRLLRQAIALLVSTWYVNRESVVVGASVSVKVDLTTTALLNQYKVWWF